MNPARPYVRILFCIMVLACTVPAASAWSFGNFSGTCAFPCPPGTPVTAGFDVKFDSWMTGTTFDHDHSMVMYSDLAGAKWTVTMTEEVNDNQLVTNTLVAKQGSQVRLDGLSLSFSRKQFSIHGVLTGTAPPLNESKTVTLLRIQEVDSGAKVSGSTVRKDLQVTVPTPEPTAAPATPLPVMTEETVLIITPDPAVTTPVPVTTSAPARRQTYSPGPDPFMVCALLGIVLVTLGRIRS